MRQQSVLLNKLRIKFQSKRLTSPPLLVFSRFEISMKLWHVVILARNCVHALCENVGRIQSCAMCDVKRLRIFPEFPLFDRDIAIAILVAGRAVMTPHGRVYCETLEIQYLFWAYAIMLPINGQKVLYRGVVLQHLSSAPQGESVCLRARYNTRTVYHPARIAVSGSFHVWMIMKIIVIWPDYSRVIFNYVTSSPLFFRKWRPTMTEPEHVPIITVWRCNACWICYILGTGGDMFELVFEIDWPVGIVLHHKGAMYIFRYHSEKKP